MYSKIITKFIIALLTFTLHTVSIIWLLYCLCSVSQSARTKTNNNNKTKAGQVCTQLWT